MLNWLNFAIQKTFMTVGLNGGYSTYRSPLLQTVNQPMTFLPSFLSFLLERSWSATDWSLQPKALLIRFSVVWLAPFEEAAERWQIHLRSEDKLFQLSLHQKWNDPFQIVALTTVIIGLYSYYSIEFDLNPRFQLLFSLRRWELSVHSWNEI